MVGGSRGWYGGWVGLGASMVGGSRGWYGGWV